MPKVTERETGAPLPALLWQLARGRVAGCPQGRPARGFCLRYMQHHLAIRLDSRPPEKGAGTLGDEKRQAILSGNAQTLRLFNQTGSRINEIENGAGPL